MCLITNEYCQENPLYLRNSTFTGNKGIMGIMLLSKPVEKYVPPLERKGCTRHSMTTTTTPHLVWLKNNN